MNKKTKQIIAIVFLAIMLCLADNGWSQNAVKDAQGNYTAIRKAPKDSSKIIATGKTFTDHEGATSPVFVQETTGRLFVRRISKKTGKEYKYFLKL